MSMQILNVDIALIIIVNVYRSCIHTQSNWPETYFNEVNGAFVSIL